MTFHGISVIISKQDHLKIFCRSGWMNTNSFKDP